MNRLAAETSPYLRQHADNPVDWRPWGPEAFDEARRLDRPVLLSVGYSSCHWCHVMAHESFEDADTAAVLNDLFVNVKVDREERPDVDAIYMEFVQATTGHGGWPMTVFLTPDGRPFYGGTYFPKTPRHGMPAFVQLCRAIDDAWRTKRAEVDADAQRVTAALGGLAQLAPGDAPPDRALLDHALDALLRSHDRSWGGFGGAPKFPQAMNLELLLRRARQLPDALDAALTSLDAMASGGIYDHLGGGFARYSTDAQWLVPHFEKMLYDNALLTKAYLHGWQLTGESRLLQVVEETIGYVLTDLRHPDGGFYSAEDADSEGVEGRFYVWSEAEIRAVCGEDADAAIDWYGVTPQGNFEGANILHRPRRGDLIRPAPVERARAALLAARSERVRPGLDDKVLTEWNALMLAALAEASAAAGRQDWLSAALANAEFLLANLRRDDGRWLRSWQAGGPGRPAGARHLAYAGDYAALVDAFTRLAEASGQARWIGEASRAADAMLELFWDGANGGLFTTGDDAEALIARPKDVMDNALPSANSTAAVALQRLAALTGEARYQERAEAILALLAGVDRRYVTAFGQLLAALDLHLAGPTEIVVAGDRPDLVAAVSARYLPDAVLAWGERYDSPLWEARSDGRAYVCRGYACLEPAAEVETLAAQLS